MRFFFCRFLSECAIGLYVAVVFIVALRPFHLDFIFSKIQIGGIYGEVCTKKGIYQGKRRLCGIVLSRFLPPQANRPKLHGQAKSPTPTSSGGLPEAPQGAFDTCAPERRVSQALLLATAKKRLLHYLLFLTLLTVLQCTS